MENVNLIDLEQACKANSSMRYLIFKLKITDFNLNFSCHSDFTTIKLKFNNIELTARVMGSLCDVKHLTQQKVFDGWQLKILR